MFVFALMTFKLFACDSQPHHQRCITLETYKSMTIAENLISLLCPANSSGKSLKKIVPFFYNELKGGTTLSIEWRS